LCNKVIVSVWHFVMFLYTSCWAFFNFVGITAHKYPGSSLHSTKISFVAIDHQNRFVGNTTTNHGQTTIKSLTSLSINFQCQIIFGYRIPYRIARWCKRIAMIVTFILNNVYYHRSIWCVLILYNIILQYGSGRFASKIFSCSAYIFVIIYNNCWRYIIITLLNTQTTYALPFAIKSIGHGQIQCTSTR